MSEQDLPIFLEDNIFNANLAKLIASKGELEGTDLTLSDIRNMIYTRRVKVNPNVTQAVETAKGKTPSINRKKTSGPSIDEILG